MSNVKLKEETFVLKTHSSVSDTNSSVGVVQDKIKVEVSPNEAVVIHKGDNPYEGEYLVHPTFGGASLDTNDKFMYEDVRVEPIPYTEISNEDGGMTIIIG